MRGTHSHLPAGKQHLALMEEPIGVVISPPAPLATFEDASGIYLMPGTCGNQRTCLIL